jgi:hypothetical protein
MVPQGATAQGAALAKARLNGSPIDPGRAFMARSFGTWPGIHDRHAFEGATRKKGNYGGERGIEHEPPVFHAALAR